MKRTAFVLTAVVAVFALLIIGTVTLRGDGGGGSGGDHRAKAALTAPENPTLWYQKVGTSFDTSKWGKPNIVVVTGQGPASDEQAAVAAIHAVGAKAYRYWQPYWYPVGRTYEGVDIGAHDGGPGEDTWTFCQSGSTPDLGRTTTDIDEDTGEITSTEDWDLLDLNEKDARNGATGYLNSIVDWGYDGVMVDRGSAAMQGGKDKAGAYVWDVQSTCTADVLVPGRYFADAYAGMMNQVTSRGLAVILNYGSPASDPKLRPDPSDPDCRARVWANCTIKSDLNVMIDHVLAEQPVTVDLSNWQASYDAGYANEHNTQWDGDRVIAYVKDHTPDTTARRDAVFYKYARAKLWAQQVAVNSGDDQCPGYVGAACFRYGTYPELNSALLGAAQGSAPTATNCDAGSTTACVWLRRYDGGVVLDNEASVALSSKAFTVGDGTACKVVTSIYSGSQYNSGACVSSMSSLVPAHGGRIFTWPTS